MMVSPSLSSHVCPWCGPFTTWSGSHHGVCPTCHLDPGEVAYAEAIMRGEVDSGLGKYRPPA